MVCSCESSVGGLMEGQLCGAVRCRVCRPQTATSDSYTCVWIRVYLLMPLYPTAGGLAVVEVRGGGTAVLPRCTAEGGGWVSMFYSGECHVAGYMECTVVHWASGLIVRNS